MDLKELKLAGDEPARHWYYRAKAEMMLSHVAELNVESVMDVGSGSGFFSRYILEHGKAQQVTCVDNAYEADHDEMVDGRPLLFRRSVCTSDADLMLMMDVLEHIEDDHAFLADYVAIAPANSHLFITVPAFQFLWSGHDIFLEHYRRYNLSQLRGLVTQAGLEIRRAHYFFGTALPIAAAMRLKDKFLPTGPPISSMRSHGRLMNSFAYNICSVEMALMRLNRLAGLSVVMLARKPGS